MALRGVFDFENDFDDVIFEDDLLNDDLEVFEIINYGVPRRIFNRHDHFNGMDDLNFFKRFRLTKHSVYIILTKVENNLEFASNRNNCISPINQLLVTLRLYATGAHQLCMADFSGMHYSTVCRIVKKVSKAIANLAKTEIRMPQTLNEIKMLWNEFHSISGFPRVIGAVDGTHIRIESPGGNDAEVFRNRKSYFSLNTQVLSDAKMKIRNIVCRWPGSAHDATIFNNSNLKVLMQTTELYKGSYILADKGYACKDSILTPLTNPVTAGEQLYNEAQIRTRGVVEKLFGIWKRRFPILAYGCRLKLDNTRAVIVATALLHNLARDQNEEMPANDDEAVLNELINLGEIENENVNLQQNNFNVRNNLIATYFNRL